MVINKDELIIREYKKEDEKGWVRCRVLSFLDSAYYDNVIREKEFYENPSIELVAEINNQIVGLIDIEYEINEGTVCSKRDGLGGMIWHLAVHPDYQNFGTNREEIFTKFKRVHECNLYEKINMVIT